MRISELSKLPFFQIFRLRQAMLVKKCVSGPIMNTNLKNFHHYNLEIYS